MTVFIAWGNIQDNYPLHLIPQELLTEKLLAPIPENLKAKQVYHCRWLANFLLWQLLKKAKINTALLGYIFRTEKGRPKLPHQHIDFNISHSDNWVAVVLQVKDQKEKSVVGIDIEYPKKTRNFTALLSQFASREEMQWFCEQGDPQSSFYRIWCLREAILKSEGVGITKLSEVRHCPNKNLINSPHCPKGELIFTDELPFYFTVFFNDKELDIQFYHWCNNELLETKLFKKIKYLVNYTSDTLKV